MRIVVDAVDYIWKDGHVDADESSLRFDSAAYAGLLGHGDDYGGDEGDDGEGSEGGGGGGGSRSHLVDPLAHAKYVPPPTTALTGDSSSRRRRHEHHKARRRSAVVIQSHQRTRRARRHARRRKDACITIEAGWRGRQARGEVHNVRDKIVKIEANWRGFSARKRLRQSKQDERPSSAASAPPSRPAVAFGRRVNRPSSAPLYRLTAGPEASAGPGPSAGLMPLKDGYHIPNVAFNMAGPNTNQADEHRWEQRRVWRQARQRLAAPMLCWPQASAAATQPATATATAASTAAATTSAAAARAAAANAASRAALARAPVRVAFGGGFAVSAAPAKPVDPFAYAFHARPYRSAPQRGGASGGAGMRSGMGGRMGVGRVASVHIECASSVLHTGQPSRCETQQPPPLASRAPLASPLRSAPQSRAETRRLANDTARRLQFGAGGSGMLASPEAIRSQLGATSTQSQAASRAPTRRAVSAAPARHAHLQQPRRDHRAVVERNNPQTRPAQAKPAPPPPPLETSASRPPTGASEQQTPEPLSRQQKLVRIPLPRPALSSHQTAPTLGERSECGTAVASTQQHRQAPQRSEWWSALGVGDANTATSHVSSDVNPDEALSKSVGASGQKLSSWMSRGPRGGASSGLTILEE